MKTPRTHVLIKLPDGERFDNVMVTESGVKFYLPINHKPQDVIKIWGEVVGVTNGTPPMGIASQVRVGDRIYFHYNCLDYDNRERRNNHYIDGEFYHRIDYDRIFCAVRGGEIIMIGGWVLVEPPPEEKETVSGGGIILLPNKKPKRPRGALVKGTLRHIGTPLKGEPDTGCIPGDKVYFPHECEFRNEIEGTTYFCMRQEDLIAKD